MGRPARAWSDRRGTTQAPTVPRQFSRHLLERHPAGRGRDGAGSVLGRLSAGQSDFHGGQYGHSPPNPPPAGRPHLYLQSGGALDQRLCVRCPVSGSRCSRNEGADSLALVTANFRTERSRASAERDDLTRVHIDSGPCRAVLRQRCPSLDLATFGARSGWRVR